MESRIIDFSWRKTGMYKPVWIGDHLSGSLKSVEDGNKGDFDYALAGFSPSQLLWISEL
jgi:hypothetical protein